MSSDSVMTWYLQVFMLNIILILTKIYKNKVELGGAVVEGVGCFVINPNSHHVRLISVDVAEED